MMAMTMLSMMPISSFCLASLRPREAISLRSSRNSSGERVFIGCLSRRVSGTRMSMVSPIYRYLSVSRGDNSPQAHSLYVATAKIPAVEDNDKR